MLKGCYKCVVILGSINLIVATVLYVLSREWAHSINFEVAYFSTLLVILGSYYTLQKRMRQEIPQAPAQDMHHLESNKDSNMLDSGDKKPVPLSKFLLGIRISFGFYRLLSYIVLGIGVIVLMDYKIFNVVYYVVGVLICLLSVVLFRLKHPEFDSRSTTI